MKSKYLKAAALLKGIGSESVVLNDTVFPQWIENSNCFSYRRIYREENGRLAKQYRLVDADTGKNMPAFNHKSLLKALSAACGQPVEDQSLPIENVKISLAPVIVYFWAFAKYWQFDAGDGTCKELDNVSKAWVISPDGRFAVFSRDYNLWLRDLTSDLERPLTSDGEKFFAYGAVGTAWGCPVGDGLQAVWSPDSTRIFTVQKDTRNVKVLPIVHHVPLDGSLRPTVTENRVALPGDVDVEVYRLLVIDVITGSHVNAQYRRIPACRNGWGFFNAGLGWWDKDSRRTYFVDQERGDHVLRVVEFDASNGETRCLFEEHSNTQINLSLNSEDYPQFVPIPKTQELIWYSERNGWAHLYLYDLSSGCLKHEITSGNWLVRNVLHYDEVRRELIVQTAARVAKRDPYYRDICRLQIDSGEMTTLLSTDHEYVVHSEKHLITRLASDPHGREIGEGKGISPNGQFIVATRSRANQPPISLLLDRLGSVISEIESADINGLPDEWCWPESVKLTAADGKTEIFGLVHRPSDFSENLSYPIINFLSNNPDVPSVSKGSFINSESNAGTRYWQAAALAELGFIVVLIDGRGTPFRSKAFLDEGYGWIPSNQQDQIVGIQQLANRFPYMDLDRVGVFSPFGATGGLHGLFEFADFYKVGVVNCAQDSRLMAGPVWSEKYEHRLDQHTPLKSSDNMNLYPEDLVSNFQGKLLIMHGMLDAVCPPATTFRVVEALVKANKDFDMLMLPNVGHDSNCFTRRAWDFLVKHLLKCEPPKDFNLETRSVASSSLLDL